MLTVLVTKLLLVCDGFDLQELFQTPMSIEATLYVLSVSVTLVLNECALQTHPAALLDTTVWKHRFIAKKSSAAVQWQR